MTEETSKVSGKYESETVITVVSFILPMLIGFEVTAGYVSRDYRLAIVEIVLDIICGIFIRKYALQLLKGRRRNTDI